MSFRPEGEIPTEIQFNESGLIPVIVQDATNQQVLMLAWMNQESLRLTLEQGETWFWSRSRGELWHKGATSGNTQKVHEIYYDCDGDTLLVKVDAAGPSCHTGEISCFFRKIGTDQ
jgi:phosphoribosyl-ATP pyrophosphohydrolase/phosphoribosyl-AMP cyclohydrolase